jgi:hypothetical protein
MKKIILFKIVLLTIVLGCNIKQNENTSSWSLDLENSILGELKTPNYLLKDSSIVIYANKKLTKASINSKEIFWKNNCINKKVHITHIKDCGREILICGFKEDQSYIYLIDYEDGSINSIDTFSSIIESLYRLDDSSNLIIYQQNLATQPILSILSAYSYKTKHFFWTILETPLFVKPYIDSNYMIIQKTDSSVYCINKKSGKFIAFPIHLKDTFALIEKLNNQLEWQLFNFIDGKITPSNVWAFKFIINKNVFTTKKLDNKLYKIALSTGEAIPFVELSDNIIYGTSYGTNILCYLGKKKAAIINTTNKKITYTKLRFEPFLTRDYLFLYKKNIFYYYNYKEDNVNNEGYKIIKEVLF